MLAKLQERKAQKAAPAAIGAWRFWVPVALQLLIVLAVPVPKLMAAVTGTPVVLRTVPVDPLDFLRGRYVALGYEIGEVDTMRHLPGFKPEFLQKHHTLYWTLAKPPEGGAWKAVALAAAPPTAVPPGDVVLQGEVEGEHVSFGLEAYYLPEDKGSRLQAALAAHRTGNLADLKVDRWGHAVLTGFSVGSERF